MNWDDYTEITTPADGDTALVHDVSETTVGQKMKRITWANIKATLKTYFDTLYASLTAPIKETSGPTVLTTGSIADGEYLVRSGTTIIGGTPAGLDWIPIADTWAYASAYTITVPSGAAAIFSVGDKIKLTQTTVKFFKVVGVADTVLTVTGGSDYVVANAAISDVYYSKSVTPVGFPDWFNLTTPAWTTSGTAFTNQPTTNVAKFRVNGRVLEVFVKATCHATSGGTGRFTATFTAGQLPTFANAGSGSAFNFNTFLTGSCWVSATAQNVVNCAKYDASALATNSEVFTMTAKCEI